MRRVNLTALLVEALQLALWLSVPVLVACVCAGALTSVIQGALQAGDPSITFTPKLFAALGEIPFAECFPELWVIDEETYPRARLLLDGWLHQGAGVGDAPWTCSNCGETVAAHFGVCWNCFQSRD